MAVIGIILIAALGSFSAYAEEVSVESACDMITASIPEKEVNVYLCKNYEDEELYWKFFVDADPRANWGHKCYIAKVLKNQGTISTNSVSLQELSFLPDIDLEEYRINVSTRASNGIISDCVDIDPIPAKYDFNANRPGKNYAIIISGGVNKKNNNFRYWNDCSLIYRILTKRYGLEKENVYVAISDGTNPNLDMNLSLSISHPRYCSSSLDLDFDGEDDTRFAATNMEIAMIFDELTDRLTKDDHLFIYVIDHGNQGLNIKTSQTESYICLWNEEELFVSDLREMIRPFRNKDVAVSAVFGQCYSGGFVEPLSSIGCVVAAACEENDVSYASNSGQYDEFVLAWSTAMCGMDISGNNVVSDFNGDGIVSMEEAFRYASLVDKLDKHPKYSSDPVEIGQYLGFNYIPPVIDLKLRDANSDNYILSNNNYLCSWDSPDIWLRNSDDGIESHQQLNLSDLDRAYVNVRVNNVGRVPNEDNYRLDVRWALAGTDVRWEFFDGNMEYKNYPLGGCVGSVDIHMIDPFNSQVFCIEWNIPDALKNAFENGAVKFNNILFYAEIVQTDLSDDISVKTRDVYSTVTLDSHAAIKNVIFANYPSMMSTLQIGNPKSTSTNYAITLYSEGFEALDFLNDYGLIVQMPQELYNKWRTFGGTTSCAKVTLRNGYANFPFTSAKDYISGIPIQGYGSELLKVELSAKPNAAPRCVDIVQRSGYTIDVHKLDVCGGTRLYASANYADTSGIIQLSQYNIVNKESMIGGECVKVELDRSAEETVGIVITDLITGERVAQGLVDVGCDCTTISAADIVPGLYSVDIRVSDYVVDSAKVAIK